MPRLASLTRACRLRDVPQCQRQLYRIGVNLASVVALRRKSLRLAGAVGSLEVLTKAYPASPPPATHAHGTCGKREIVMIQRHWLRPALAGLISLCATAVPAVAQSPRVIEFNRHIRPILSDNCFAC